MEKLGTKLGRSNKTIMQHINHFNSTLEVLREWDKCAQVKSQLAKEAIA